MNAVEYLVHDPVGQSAIVPFLAAAILALLIRLICGARLGGRVATAAIVLAFLLAYQPILGVPPFPPVSSTQKLPYIAVIAAIVGLAFELTLPGAALKAIATGIVPFAALIWLAARRLVPFDPRIAPDLLALYCGTIAVHWCAAQADQRESQVAVTPALAASILGMVGATALAAITFFGGAPVLGQLGTVLASASGGYILIAWLYHVLNGETFRFGAIGTIGIVNVTAAIVSIHLLFAEHPDRIAILIVGLVFAMHFIARPATAKITAADERLGRALRPICYGLIVSIAMAIEMIYLLFVAPNFQSS